MFWLSIKKHPGWRVFLIYSLMPVIFESFQNDFDINRCIKNTLLIMGVIVTLILFTAWKNKDMINQNSIYSDNNYNGFGISGSGSELIKDHSPSIHEKREVTKYEAINVNGSFNFFYRVSDVVALEVIAPAKILPLITTEVRSGVLVVSSNRSFSTRSEVKVVASGPSLKVIELNGSGDVEIENIDTPKIQVYVKGSGDVQMQGVSRMLEMELMGSGNIMASKVYADVLHANLKGSGDIKARASQSATVNLKGSGDVYIFGQPTQREVNKRGSGDVIFK